MAKIDSTKEKINILRDEHRNLFIILIAIGTGSVSIFHQEIITPTSINNAVIGLLGLMIVMSVMAFMFKKNLI